VSELLNKPAVIVRDVEPNAVSSNASAVTVNVAALT
jgi:hypothetical protein